MLEVYEYPKRSVVYMKYPIDFDWVEAIGPEAMERIDEVLYEVVCRNLDLAYIAALTGAMRWPGYIHREVGVFNEVYWG